VATVAEVVFVWGKGCEGCNDYHLRAVAANGGHDWRVGEEIYIFFDRKLTLIIFFKKYVLILTVEMALVRK